jgi:hypothetical protein
VERDSSTGSGAQHLTAEVDLTVTPTRIDLHDPRVRADVEAALRSVPGILSARLVPGFERQVDELHVVVAFDKQPKQAVRDAQTVLMARYGVPTDHRVISVVQLDELDRRAGASTRVVIDRVGLTQSGGRLTVEVALREGDRELLGTAEATASGAARIRAVAEAALAAARPLLGDGLVAQLEATDVTDLLGHRLAISLVQLRDRRSHEVLAGCALVRDDDAVAVARSVLDALNRAIDDAGL